MLLTQIKSGLWFFSISYSPALGFISASISLSKWEYCTHVLLHKAAGWKGNNCVCDNAHWIKNMRVDCLNGTNGIAKRTSGYIQITFHMGLELNNAQASENMAPWNHSPEKRIQFLCLMTGKLKQFHFILRTDPMPFRFLFSKIT